MYRRYYTMNSTQQEHSLYLQRLLEQAFAQQCKLG
jgi:hypothetical protein